MDFVGGRIKGYCGPKELGAPDEAYPLKARRP